MEKRLTVADALDSAVRLHEAGKLDDAELIYRATLARLPTHPEALHLLGCAQLQRGRYYEAAELIEKAIGIDSRAAQFYNSLGMAQRALNRRDQAEASYRRALEIEPNFAEAIGNLGNVLHHRGDLANAEALQRRAVALEPHQPVFHNNLGTTLYDQGDLAGAEDCFHSALVLDPKYPDAHFHLGLIMLHRGDYQAGWSEYEWRWRMRSFVTPLRNFNVPQWRGEKLNGARVLLHTEQGFGDMIQFARYVPLVARAGGTVVLEAPKELMRLFAGIAGTAEIVERGQPLPPVDYHCSLMSLPISFDTTVATIPASTPYFEIPTDIAEHWRRRLTNPRHKVGLFAAGRVTWKAHYDRSVPTAVLASLALPGIAFYSLQKNAPLEVPGTDVTDLTPEFKDFADTAAAILALDLVVTIDSAVAHLAGALGRPVWLLLHAMADWRWLIGRDDSPWYPTMRLFRQQKPGDWAEPIARVTAGLKSLTDGRPFTT